MTKRNSYLAALPLLIVCLAACASAAPDKVPHKEGDALAPCPKSPNCVSSTNRDARHGIAPLSYATAIETAMKALTDILLTEKRANIISRQSNYIHAEFTSALFGFIDDVEFLFDPDQSIVQVRSASRSGYYDFGVNRKRIESIRKQFDDALRRD